MSIEQATKTDKVWFVTGASSGFGRAVTVAVLENGGRVAAAGLEPEAIEELVSPYSDRAVAMNLDVADAAAVQDAIDRCVARFGRVDVVYNNAGYGHVGAVEELTDTELRRQIDVNLFGVINVTRAALRHMRKQRSGHLLQQSSLNGVEGLVGAAYYAASKFGIEGFSESLADEVAHLGIRVTIIEPGPFRTRFLDDRSVKWSEPMPDYAESVGKSRATLRAMNGKQPGDPQRAADAILRAVEAQQPPRRLALGQMAIDHIRASLAAELKELDEWAEIGARADFPQEAGSAAKPKRSRKPPKKSTSAAARSHEELVRRAYTAFNDREIDAAVALMDPEVDWPDVGSGGYVHGRAAVGRHWREQFDEADPRIEVDDVTEKGEGRVEARVRQIARGPQGRESDERVVHVFTIADDRIMRMDVRR